MAEVSLLLADIGGEHAKSLSAEAGVEQNLCSAYCVSMLFAAI